MLPQFLIAGAAKSGSSTLYHYLSSHPEVFMPDQKEPAFFSKYYNKGLNWYESLFAETQPGQVAGEATVEYMVNPDSAFRIAMDIPDVKLIFILRNPIDRAWSHYWHRVKNGEETRKFGDILINDDVCEEYLVRYGLYYKSLERFYNLFDAKQIKVIILEEAKRDFPTVIKQIYSFIGISEDCTPTNIKTKNKSAMHKSRLLARVSANIRQCDSLKEILPDPLLQPMRAVFSRINKANLKDWEYPTLKEDHRKQLKDLFANDVGLLDTIYPGASQIWDI